MKKIILTAIAALFAAATVSAQYVNQAIENLNNGVMSQQMGDNASALEFFKQALAIAESCGDAGNDVVAQCKTVIPATIFAIGKQYIDNDDYDNAIATLNEAMTSAKEYGNAEVQDAVPERLFQAYFLKGNSLIKAKNLAGAIEAINQAIAIDPENGRAYLLLGSAYASSGKIADADSAYTKAGKYGEESSAAKQLTNLYLRVANSYYKSAKYNEAIAAAEKSASYNTSNANAYLIAANSSQKLGDNAAAISYFEKYIAVPKAKNVNAYTFTIAVLYQQAGNKEKAIEYYQKVASDPQYGAQAQEQLKALQK